MDITVLALAAGRGDTTAATEFIRATQRDVMRFLAPLTLAADVEDLTQETYLRALRSLPEFAGRSRVARAREDLVAALDDRARRSA